MLAPSIGWWVCSGPLSLERLGECGTRILEFEPDEAGRRASLELRTALVSRSAAHFEAPRREGGDHASYCCTNRGRHTNDNSQSQIRDGDEHRSPAYARALGAGSGGLLWRDGVVNPTGGSPSLSSSTLRVVADQ
jgi:hypothetical protein